MADRRLYVYGAGAVGGYLGARLSLTAPSTTVVLIARPAVAEAVSSRGLVLKEGRVERYAHPAAVSAPHPEGTRYPSTLPPADAVLLTVRTFDVAAAIPHLRPLLGGGGVLVAFQNGVGTEEELAASLGPDRVVAATLTVSVVVETPGVIQRLSSGGGVALSTMNGSPVPAWLRDAFVSTGLPTVTVPDYRSLRWSKLLLNMLGAATSAILDMDIGEVMANPDLFRIEQLALREAGRVMGARGIKTIDLPGYQVRRARLAMRLPRPLAQRVVAPRVVRARSGHSPGSRRDMQRGRSELGSFHGAVVGAALEAGGRAPMNAALTAIANELVAHPERREDLRGRPDRLLAELRERGVRL